MCFNYGKAYAVKIKRKMWKLKQTMQDPPAFMPCFSNVYLRSVECP